MAAASASVKTAQQPEGFVFFETKAKKCKVKIYPEGTSVLLSASSEDVVGRVRRLNEDSSKFVKNFKLTANKAMLKFAKEKPFEICGDGSKPIGDFINLSKEEVDTFFIGLAILANYIDLYYQNRVETTLSHEENERRIKASLLREQIAELLICINSAKSADGSFEIDMNLLRSLFSNVRIVLGDEIPATLTAHVDGKEEKASLKMIENLFLCCGLIGLESNDEKLSVAGGETKAVATNGDQCKITAIEVSKVRVMPELTGVRLIKNTKDMSNDEIKVAAADMATFMNSKLSNDDVDGTDLYGSFSTMLQVVSLLNARFGDTRARKIMESVVRRSKGCSGRYGNAYELG